MGIAILVLIKTAVAVIGIGIATLVSLISILPLSYAWVCVKDAHGKFSSTKHLSDNPEDREKRLEEQFKAMAVILIAMLLVVVAGLIWVASVGVLVLTCIVLLIFP